MRHELWFELSCDVKSYASTVKWWAWNVHNVLQSEMKKQQRFRTPDSRWETNLLKSSARRGWLGLINLFMTNISLAIFWCAGTNVKSNCYDVIFHRDQDKSFSSFFCQTQHWGSRAADNLIFSSSLVSFSFAQSFVDFRKSFYQLWHFLNGWACWSNNLHFILRASLYREPFFARLWKVLR